MGADGLFTDSDLRTICRAASLAERLTEKHFSLGKDHWRIEPYKIFTLKQVSQGLYEPDVFANVVKLKVRNGQQKQKKPAPAEKYGIVLQDPNILRALLRRQSHHDLWTISLFVLTHELIHVVRFKQFNVDFFADIQARQTEESLVQSITGEILSGVTNTDQLLALYADSKDMLERAN
jgi:hypothetical protein